MDSPYQAPTADLTNDDNNNISLTGFKKLSTWYVLLYTILSLGLYIIYWLFSRTKILNEKHYSNPVSDALMYSAIVIYLISYPLMLVEVFVPEEAAYVLTSQLISFVGNILLIVWTFKFRNRLNTYLNLEKSNTKYLGPVMTFFFQTLYLSFKLNENIEARQET